MKVRADSSGCESLLPIQVLGKDSGQGSASPAKETATDRVKDRKSGYMGERIIEAVLNQSAKQGETDKRTLEAVDQIAIIGQEDGGSGCREHQNFVWDANTSRRLINMDRSNFLSSRDHQIRLVLLFVFPLDLANRV